MTSSRLKQSWGGAVLRIARRFLSPQVKFSEGTRGTWSRIVAAAGERCLSLMGISGPYEDTLNSEAKGVGAGLGPGAGASEHSQEAALVGRLCLSYLDWLGSRVPGTEREQGYVGENTAGRPDRVRHIPGWHSSLAVH